MFVDGVRSVSLVWILCVCEDVCVICLFGVCRLYLVCVCVSCVYSVVDVSWLKVCRVYVSCMRGVCV